MTVKDDGSKLAKPMSNKVKTAKYKQGHKNAVISEGREIVGRKSAFNGNEFGLNPEQALMSAERKPRKAKQHKVDPFMVRQAKLLAAKQAAQ